MSFFDRAAFHGLLVGSLLALAPGGARADLTKRQCVEANANGQHLVGDGKLSAARAQFQACAAAACPPAIQSDCTKRLDALDKAQPSILFEAKDPSGNDIAGVAVTMDGAPFAANLEGTPLRADPGPHVFVFTAPGFSPATKTFVLAEDDPSRRERIVLGSSILPPPATPVTPSVSAVLASERPLPTPNVAPSERGSTTVRTLGIVSGGVGVVGLGVGTLFAVLAASALHSQNSDCPTSGTCPHYQQALSDHSAYATDTAAEVAGFIAGGVFLAAGVALFVVGGKGRGPSDRRATLLVLPEVTPGRMGLQLQARF